MKIAYILPSLVNKGPIIVIDTLIRNLIDKVESIDVYYFDETYGQDFICPTYKIDFNKPIDFDQYDIVHSNMYRPDKYVVKWRSRIKKAKVVSTVHQDIFANLKYSYNVFVALLYTPLWLKMLKQFDTTVAISSKINSLYSAKLNNMHIIYNGVDLVLEQRLIDKDIEEKIRQFRMDGLKIIGTYATLTAGKGVDQILTLMSTRTDFAFVVIGEGEAKDDLIKQAKKLNISDRVLFLSYLQKPYNYIPLFDIYAMCSRSEGFGLALVEAALLKASIVCSDIEVFHEIFSEKEVSFFTLDDVSSLSLAIDQALGNGVSKGEKAYEKACLKFNGQKMAFHYLQLYKLII